MRTILAFGILLAASLPARAQEAGGTKKVSKPSTCHDAASCFAECDQGIAGSCETVGGYFENGIGVQQNLEKASQFYQQACRGGDKRACHKRNALRAAEEGAPKKVVAPPADDGKSASAGKAASSKQERKGAKCKDRCASEHSGCLSAEDADSEQCAARAALCEASCEGTENRARPNEEQAIPNPLDLSGDGSP
jgi:TPR repeat protein